MIKKNKQTTFFITKLGHQELWVDKYQYMIRNPESGENVGYFPSLLQLTHYLFKNKIKIALHEKHSIEKIAEVVQEAEKNITAMSTKLEDAAVKKVLVSRGIKV